MLPPPPPRQQRQLDIFFQINLLWFQKTKYHPTSNCSANTIRIFTTSLQAYYPFRPAGRARVFKAVSSAGPTDRQADTGRVLATIRLARHDRPQPSQFRDPGAPSRRWACCKSGRVRRCPDKDNGSRVAADGQGCGKVRIFSEKVCSSSTAWESLVCIFPEDLQTVVSVDLLSQVFMTKIASKVQLERRDEY